MPPRFRIRKSPDQRLFASFPEHIAGYHVLHRLSMPRHPPCTLSSLTTFIDHRHDLPTEELTPGRSPTGAPETVQTIDKGLSPKRCSTISTRQKDQNGWKSR